MGEDRGGKTFMIKLFELLNAHTNTKCSTILYKIIYVICIDTNLHSNMNYLGVEEFMKMFWKGIRDDLLY